MITFEEAYEKAKSLKSDIDLCTEYDNAYFFETDLSYLGEDDFIIGGTDMPCIIMKADGRAVNMTTYMMEEGEGEEIGKLPLPE